MLRHKTIHANHVSEYVRNFKLNTEESDDYSFFLSLLHKALEKLPEKCRQIFILNKLEGLTQKEIAEYLEISVKTVENQIAIAVSKLREELKPFLHLLPAALLYIFY